MADSAVEASRFRTLKGPLGLVARVIPGAIPLAAAFFVLDVPSYLKLSILREQYLGLFLALVLGSVFLLVPPTRGSARHRLPWYDGFLAALGMGAGLYVALFYPRILRVLGELDPPRIVIATLAILLILEAVRRLTGWVLLAIGALFILYARFAWLAPGGLAGLGSPWPQLANYLFLDSNSVLGMPLAVAAVIVVPFVFFGNLLGSVGGGKFITDLALAALGRFRGGPAKMSVVSSSLFGTISGSAVANVAVDGWITIPLMKNTGWKPHWAAAVEAVASTGGQLMPPIMGAAAFIMAEFLGIPYREVILAALLPSILYYVAVFTQVDLEAGKAGLRGLPPQQLPSLEKVMGQAWLFIIPFMVLLYALFGLAFEPGKAGFMAVLAVLFVSLFQSRTRFRGGWLLQGLEGTGRAMMELGVVVTLAGFIIGVLAATGVGFRLSLSLVQLAGGSVAVLLVLTALANIILGMGMPTTAVYILLAVLTGPALIQMGIPPLAAHMFILYFGMLSMITPPICMAIYVAASIAGSPLWRTGFAGMRLGVVAYVVPFLFVLSPALLLLGSPWEVAQAATTAILGAILLSVALSGYLFQPLKAAKRILFTLAGIGLLIPASGQLLLVGLVSDIIGGGLALGLVAWEWRERRGPPVA